MNVVLPSYGPRRTSLHLPPFVRTETTKEGSAMTAGTDLDDLPAVNVSVVCGPCSAAPEIKVLESGTRLATLAIRCPTGDDRATSVPVTVWDPPAWVEALEPGDAVVVVGRLRRRFYQRPGGVGARVDIEAELIGRARERRRLDAAVRKAETALDALR